MLKQTLQKRLGRLVAFPENPQLPKVKVVDHAVPLALRCQQAYASRQFSQVAAIEPIKLETAPHNGVAASESLCDLVDAVTEAPQLNVGCGLSP